MSLAVELDKLLEVAGGFGTTPMMLTTDEDGRPRASGVAVTWDGELARVRAGYRSVANAAERALVSLLYPAPPGERFALLIDGVVEGTEPDDVPPDAREGSRRAKPGGYVAVRATSATLHIVARPHG